MILSRDQLTKLINDLMDLLAGECDAVRLASDDPLAMTTLLELGEVSHAVP
jgi:hypothetical protein